VPVNITVCIDVECTCDSPLQIHPMEIIELACVKKELIPIECESKDAAQTYSLFHSYVRPEVNPELTLFCQELTGIMQSTVDNAETIDKVTSKLLQWLKDENLVDDKYRKSKNFAFASCGNFDLKILTPPVQDNHFRSNSELPIYFKEWINVKKIFVNHKREWPRSLYHMTELLGIEPSGRLHSAKDDCLNLAKVVESLHKEGCELHVTNRIQ